jgi:hypothetical protein
MASPWVEDAKNALFTGFDYMAMPGDYMRGLIGNTVNRVTGGPLLKNRLTGREMFEGMGLLDPNQEGLDVGDVLGFGADLILDPINLALGGAGALSGVGKGAIKGARGLAGLVKAGKGAEALAQAKTALGAIPGAAMKALPGLGVLGGTMGTAYGGGALLSNNEEGSDLQDLLGMGMLAAPFLLPLGMTAARKLRGARAVKADPAVQAAVAKSAAEAKALLEVNKPRMFSSAELMGPTATKEGTDSLMSAISRLRYKTGADGGRKGRAQAMKDLADIDIVDDAARPLMERQHAAMRLVSKWGDEAATRASASEGSLGALEQLKRDFGYRLPDEIRDALTRLPE